jgi:hypothetical protein
MELLEKLERGKNEKKPIKINNNKNYFISRKRQRQGNKKGDGNNKEAQGSGRTAQGL